MARGDIAFIDLPKPSGSHVQGGLRPAVLVIADGTPQGNPLTMVVPFTSNLGATRFPFTLRIDPSPQNGLTTVSIALVFQLCAVDKTSVVSVIGSIEGHHLTQIDRMMRQMLGV